MNNLYNEIIMKHYTESMYKKDLSNYTFSSMGSNPSCGDEINLKILVENNILSDIGYTGHGCAISLSSASIMCNLVINKNINDVLNLLNLFDRMLNEEEICSEEKNILCDAMVFENMINMPARMKCVKLSWATLKKMLTDLK